MVTNLVENKLNELESLLGYKLELYDESEGLKNLSYYRKGKKIELGIYFNVKLDNQYAFSTIAKDLERIKETYPNVFNNVLPNGYKRIAIFI